jgi:hypothetical protein
LNTLNRNKVNLVIDQIANKTNNPVHPLQRWERVPKRNQSPAPEGKRGQRWDRELPNTAHHPDFLDIN